MHTLVHFRVTPLTPIPRTLTTFPYEPMQYIFPLHSEVPLAHMGATFYNFEFLASAFCLPLTLIAGLVRGAPHAARLYEIRQFPGRLVSK